MITSTIYNNKFNNNTIQLVCTGRHTPLFGRHTPSLGRRSRHVGTANAQAETKFHVFF